MSASQCLIETIGQLMNNTFAEAQFLSCVLRRKQHYRKRPAATAASTLCRPGRCRLHCEFDLSRGRLRRQENRALLVSCLERPVGRSFDPFPRRGLIFFCDARSVH